MEQTNTSNNNVVNTTISNAPTVIFSKEHTTLKRYKELIKTGMSVNAAVKTVCDEFDSYCRTTQDISYLMERYTELYNEIVIKKPMAISVLAILISIAVNILFSFFDNTDVDLSLGAFSIILLIVKYVLFTTIWMCAIDKIFKQIGHTYSPYDVFVKEHERRTIYDTLKDDYFDRNIGE